MDVVKISKFLVAGGSAAAFEFILFYTLHGINGIDLLLSQTISFLAGFVTSFLLNKHWVFQSSGKSKSELIKYGILAAINIVLTNVALRLLVAGGIIYWAAKVIVMALVAVWNYSIFQRIIFNNK